MLQSRAAYAGIMILSAFVAAILIRRQQRAIELEPSQRIAILVGALVGATLFAKLPFIFTGMINGYDLPSLWLSDGKTVLWGLAGGYLGVEFAKWTFYVNVSTGDSFVAPIAIAIGIGRLGCLLYGCCYGIETDQSWGIAFPSASDAGTRLRHPTQLYELAFHFCFAAIVMKGIAMKRWKSNWMPIYMIAYSAFRFMSEYLRPEPIWFVRWTFYQWSSLLIGSSFIILLLYRCRQQSMTKLNTSERSFSE